MNDIPQDDGDLAEEFRQLGKNLVDTLRLAWDSPERKKLQDEIESGLVDVVSSLKREAGEFKASPPGQKLKEEIDDMRQSWESGEAEAKARQEIMNAIRMANNELQKWSEKWQKGSGESNDQ
ncbi:MAG: hypothetical protein JW908_17185 [Anaerolineales bacterium]|nr:hypothetical protein [Anaerolineales bacterium]